MSLIEKALNKASRETTSPPPDEGPPGIDPTSIVSAARRSHRSIWSLLGAGLLVLTALVLSVFLYPHLRVTAPRNESLAPKGTLGTQPSSAVAIPPPHPPGTKAAEPAALVGSTSEQNNQGSIPETVTPGSPVISSVPSEGFPVTNGQFSPPVSPTRDDLQRSRALPPITPSQDFTDTLLKKAYAFGEAGKFAQAITCYDSILSLSPHHYEARLNRGIINQKLDHLNEAEKDLLFAAEVHADDPILLNALGVLYLKRGDEEKAREFLLKAGDATSLTNLSLLYWKTAQWGKVIEVLHKAEEKDGQNPYAPYYRGLAYLQLGDTSAAADAFEKAAQLARRRGLTDLLQTIDSVSFGH